MPDHESDLLMQAARALRHRWAKAYEPFGVTPHQARTLRAIAQRDASRPSAIADTLGISPRSATEVVDALEQAGLVRREPDLTDRRAVRVVLTPRGRTTLEAMTAVRAQDADDFFGRLTDHERASLRRLLGKLVPD